MGCIETKDYVSKIHKHINENNIYMTKISNILQKLLTDEKLEKEE